MFTPQEVQERTFVKAIFGGYDMESVDEFLEPLVSDYVTLYKENSVLKSKMKVLVDKLEEYRNQEESMKKTMVAAQKTADEMVAEAQKKCARLLSDAESSARNKSVDLQQTMTEEEERVNRAKQVAQDFIGAIEAQVNHHLELLGKLREMSMAAPARHAYDYEEEADKDASPEEVAREIAHNLEKTIGAELGTPAAKPEAKPTDKSGSASSGDTRVMEPLNPKFADLQFGRNYDPKA